MGGRRRAASGQCSPERVAEVLTRGRQRAGRVAALTLSEAEGLLFRFRTTERSRLARRYRMKPRTAGRAARVCLVGKEVVWRGQFGDITRCGTSGAVWCRFG